VAYVGLLFVIAYLGDRHTRNRTGGFLRSPIVYTLSISVYCTSWTFYGSVGTAARTGLAYLTIYLGPTIVFAAWWSILRHRARSSHDMPHTSMAYPSAARFANTSTLAVLLSVLAGLAIGPYTALPPTSATSSAATTAGASASGRGSLAGWEGSG